MVDLDNSEVTDAGNYPYVILMISRTHLRYWLTKLGLAANSPMAMVDGRVEIEGAAMF